MYRPRDFLILGSFPLLLACPDPGATTETSATASGGATTTTTTTGGSTSGEEPAGPKLPLENSVLVLLVDVDNEPIPGAWLQQLPPEPEPKPPVGDTDTDTDTDTDGDTDGTGTGGTTSTGGPDDTTTVGLVPTALPDSPVQPRSSSEVLTADTAGQILVEGMAAGQHRWIIGAPGFATRTEVVSVDPGTHAGMELRLTRLGMTTMISTSQVSNVSYKNVDIRFPAGPMVRANTNESYHGEVKATITVINPTTGNRDDPVVPLVGQSTQGARNALYSFGMVGVELSDPVTGDALELDGNVTATVSFSLDEEQSAMISKLGLLAIPAWHASPKRGDTVWQEIGDFVLTKDSEGKYRGTTQAVREFSWINFDLKGLEPRCYEITVIDGANNPIPGQPLTVQSNNMKKSTFTGAEGTVCYDQLVGTTSVVTVDEEILSIDSIEGHPKSLCQGNNWPNYINYPHGKCTQYTIKLVEPKVCVPGSTWSCGGYPEPDKLGFGLCKEAEKVCNLDGLGWSDCTGHILPEPDICDGFDNDCNGGIDDDPNIKCGCMGPPECYSGKEEWEGVGICVGGTRTCEGGEWGKCEGEVLPEPELEDCLEPNKSCLAAPCSFKDQWWDTMGTKGQHSALATHIGDGWLTVVTNIIGGDLHNYGECAGKLDDQGIVDNFTGLATFKYSLASDVDEYMNQSCSDGMDQPGIVRSTMGIKGSVPGTSALADAEPDGIVVAGKSDGSIDPSLTGKLAGCGDAIKAGVPFIERMNEDGLCLFRVQIMDKLQILDVAVGTPGLGYDGETYAAVYVPSNEEWKYDNCDLSGKINHGVYILRLVRENDKVACKNPAGPFFGESHAKLDVSVLEGNGTVAMASRNGSSDEIVARVFKKDLALIPETTQTLATAAAGQIGKVKILDVAVAVEPKNVAVTGTFDVEALDLKFFQEIVEPVSAKGEDVFVLIADKLAENTRGTFMVGGSPTKGSTDFSYAVEWVNLYSEGQTVPGFLVAGTAYGTDFEVNGCLVESMNEGDEYDGFIAAFPYFNDGGSNVIGETCQHVHGVYGQEAQSINAIAISGLNDGDPKMRVAVCGEHSQALKVAGEIVEKAPMNGITGAHCGYTVFPVTP